MKARGLSYEVWNLAWELKHIGPVIKLSSCAGVEKYELTFGNQCGKLRVSTADLGYSKDNSESKSTKMEIRSEEAPSLPFCCFLSSA